MSSSGVLAPKRKSRSKAALVRRAAKALHGREGPVGPALVAGPAVIVPVVPAPRRRGRSAGGAFSGGAFSGGAYSGGAYSGGMCLGGPCGGYMVGAGGARPVTVLRLAGGKRALCAPKCVTNAERVKMDRRNALARLRRAGK